MARDYVGELQQNSQSNVPNFLKKTAQNGQLNSGKTTSSQSPLNTVLSLIGGGFGGFAGGVAGGAAGALVPGADLTGVPEVLGAYGGGIAGAGAGAAAGNGAADMIRNLAGGENINPQDSLSNTLDQAKSGAVGQLVGVPLAKTLGFLAHPIASQLSQVDKILARSPKSIDFFNYMDKVGGQGVNELAAKGYGQQAQQFFADTLAPNLRAAAQQAVEAAPGVGATTNILDQNVPLAAANFLKRNLSSGLKYGEQGKPSQELTKTAVRYLKDAIVQAEPSISNVKIGPLSLPIGPNNRASAMYKVPEFLQSIASMLPGKGSNALNMLATLGRAPIQTTIPQGGGYLNQLIPRGLQFLLGGGGAESN